MRKRKEGENENEHTHTTESHEAPGPMGLCTRHPLAIAVSRWPTGIASFTSSFFVLAKRIRTRSPAGQGLVKRARCTRGRKDISGVVSDRPATHAALLDRT
jgi:hypothetical protein